MEDENLEEKIESSICLYQWIRPKYYFEKEGYGDCRKCTTDYKNKYCKGYYPIFLYKLKVTDGQTKKT